MIEWLKSEWFSLASIYSEDKNLVLKLWETIKNNYTHKSRYYHNLSHIYNMLIQAEEIEAKIDDYDAFRFSIWYHDIIYKSSKKDNEIKSADFAKKELKSIHFDEKRIEIVVNLIKSTQKHNILLFNNSDNAFLLDIDLSILGTDWKTYEKYITNIRKEYAIYPDFIYKKGRKKAMQHFLERAHIFFTSEFKTKLENQARENITKEIALL